MPGLDKELTTYDRERASLLSQNAGKFVLIKDNNVLGIFDTQKDAIAEGYKRLGYVPFLVKEILAVDVPMDFSSGALAV